MPESEKRGKKHPLLILGSIAAAVSIGIALNALAPGENTLDFASTGWANAPDADIGEGLSVHYSGGSLPDDVSARLETNGIR